MAKSPKKRALKLLICGIPASGKSCFGRWLRDRHQFSFIELEAKPTESSSLDAHGLREPWEKFWRGEDLRKFPETLLSSDKPIALEWGFPVSLLHVVVVLQKAGIRPWWFDGDRLAAREHFIARHDQPVELFDQQVAAIAGAWCAIAPVFAGRIVRVPQGDGTFAMPQTIWRAIVAAA